MWICPLGHNPEEVIASVPEEFDPDHIGFLVDAESGLCTNRCADGTAGVSEAQAELAESDESPVCPKCYEYCEWYEGDGPPYDAATATGMYDRDF